MASSSEGEQPHALEELLVVEFAKLRSEIRADVRQELNELRKPGKASNQMCSNISTASKVHMTEEVIQSSRGSRFASAIAAAAAKAGGSGHSPADSRPMSAATRHHDDDDDDDILGHHRRVFHTGMIAPYADKQRFGLPVSGQSSSQEPRVVRGFRRSRTVASDESAESGMKGSVSELPRPVPTIVLPGQPDRGDDGTCGEQPALRTGEVSDTSKLEVPLREEAVTAQKSTTETSVGHHSCQIEARQFKNGSNLVEQKQTAGHTVGEDVSEESSFWRRVSSGLAQVVTDDRFDYIVGLVVFLYAVFLGVQTSLEADSARTGIYAGDAAIRSLSIVFCLLFSVEMSLRLAVYGRFFFRGSDWKFNVFDFLLVIMQLFETGVDVSLSLSHNGWESKGSSSGGGLMPLRVLRGLRLIRIIRIARVIHLFSELRSMIGSIVSTIKSLMWTVILLSLLMYSVGIYFSQVVSDFGRDRPEVTAEGTPLNHFFGNVPRSVSTLFMAITGGVDWHEVSDPLIEHVSPLMGVMFFMYIAFTLFSMLNVITGIFVDSALRNTKDEADIDMINYLHSVFRYGQITLSELEKQLDDPKMIKYFASIDLHTSEARFLFRLLDIHGTGSIDAEDFIMGCLRLRGPAKAIDLATLMSETRRLKLHWHQHIRTMEETFACTLASPGGSMVSKSLGSPTAVANTSVLEGSGGDSSPSSFAAGASSKLRTVGSAASLDWLEEDKLPIFARQRAPTCADDNFDKSPVATTSASKGLAQASECSCTRVDST